MTTKWLGQKTCDFCGVDVSTQKEFYDAVTVYGSWALMCARCFHINGIGEIGLGKGQKYSGKSFEKIGG